MPKHQEYKSPVHVVLVSLLFNQLSGLFLIFFGRPKKIVQSQGIFGQSLGIFGTPKRNLVDQKFPETDQKFPETGQFFLVIQKE